MTAIKKTLIAAVLLVGLIILAGFIIAPSVLKPVLIKNIAGATHRNVALDRIKINPLTASVTIQGFRIDDPGRKEPFVSFDELYVDAGLIMSALKRGLILEEVRLVNPYVRLTRNADGTYNFSDLIPEEKAKKEEPSKPFLFSVNNIQISGGNADFHDLPNQTDHTVRNMHLTIPFISNTQHDIKKYVEPKFSATINGHPVRASGKTMPFESSRATIFDVDLTDVDIPYYLQYVPVRLYFKMVSAALDTHLRITFMTHQDRSPDLSVTGQAELKKVIINDTEGNKLLRIPSLKVDIASLEPFVPKVHLAGIAIESPELAVKRDKKGDLNLAKLVGPDKKPDKKDEGAKPKTSSGNKTDENQKAGKKAELNLLVDHFLINRADVLFTDAGPARPAKIQIASLKLQVSKFTLNRDEKARVDLVCNINRQADLAVNGALSVNPLAGDLAVGVKNLAIRPFQPYFADAVQLDVTGGAVSTDGKVTLATDSHQNPSITYTGNLAVTQLATIDRARANDFLKFKRLAFNSLSAGYNPLFVNIREISLADFFARIVINEGGSTNIQDITGSSKTEAQKQTAAARPASAEKDKKPVEPPPDIKIGKVNFSGGTVDFADRNIKPNYRVTMLNLQGSVTGLSSQEISRARVALKGNLGYGSPIDIGGTMNPLAKDLFADIKVSFKDIEMSPVSPYTIKFLGYPIVKGKLNFDVSYLIDQRKLTAENKVFFDQLTFGEKVESPDAIKAPVTLAVSLLTDRSGKINLDIPLSGSLDDPKFKVWPIIWQILVNLITKAVTSPFALLSSVTGGGEEMSYVEFDYGTARLSESELKKIQALAKVLYDRPSLKMDIEGYADAIQDKEAVKKARLTRLLKTQKLKEMMDKGPSDASLDTIVISQAEYPKYLALAYKAADFPKPRTALGFLKEVPPADMEKMMLDNITVTENDLTQLAARRAQNVRDQLLQAGKIEPSRIFLVQAPSLSAEKKDKVKNSRVNFKLK